MKAQNIQPNSLRSLARILHPPIDVEAVYTGMKVKLYDYSLYTDTQNHKDEIGLIIDIIYESPMDEDDTDDYIEAIIVQWDDGEDSTLTLDELYEVKEEKSKKGRKR